MENVCVLVSSFDGYSDLWKPLEESYNFFWNDCPYNIYISTNFIDKGFSKFIPVAIGKDNSWSDMMAKTIKNIKEDYILLTFDDLFFYKKINTKKIQEEVEKAIALNANYFQLTPSISRTRKVSETIKEKLKNTKYRNGTVWSLWKKEVLLDLLKKEETAWDFEIKGNKRCNEYNNFFSSSKELVPYLNGVIKGVWVKDVLKKIKKQGIEIDLTKRKVMTNYEYGVYKIKAFLYNSYRKIVF